MTIVSLEDLKGANRFGNCAECGDSVRENREKKSFHRITFNNGTSVLLCEWCIENFILSVHHEAGVY